MKILIYSHTFWPNVGGVEDVGHALATGLAELGQEVTVVTPIKCDDARITKYKIIRHPSRLELARLVRNYDLIHTNGSSMSMLPFSLLMNKPFTWTHHGYQLQCIDGAGWANGQAAPMQPLPSCLHHGKLFGPLPAFIGGCKLLLRRLGASLVAANVASSKHVALRQPLPKQRIIYNPFDVEFFAAESFEQAESQLNSAATTFTFIGRLITEKGVDDLLYALADISQQEEQKTGTRTATLKIIGDGPEKQALQSLAEKLKLNSQVLWESSKVGSELKKELATAGICVIPSAWEEPGALIVMSLMAAGKPLIVSETGWLSECAGDACLTFPNRDRVALAKAMDKLRSDSALQVELIKRALKRIEEFRPERSLQAYVSMFNEITGLSKPISDNSLSGRRTLP